MKICLTTIYCQVLFQREGPVLDGNFYSDPQPGYRFCGTGHWWLRETKKTAAFSPTC